MTFDENMQLVQQEAIPELYAFTAGGYVWRYTSYKTDLTFLGNLHKSAPIKRSGFTVDREPGSARVNVTMFVSDPLKKYISATPIPSTRVEIWRAVSSSLSDYVLMFEGIVQRFTAANGVLTVECGQSGKLRVRLPTLVHQSFCNWQVFDCGCGLDPTLWDVPAEVTVSASTLISGTFAGYANGYFTQGKIYYDGDYRFITNHEGNTIWLQIPFQSLASGSTVVAYPGCNGSPKTCKTKFNNFDDRHLSMPYIPSHNPVVWGFK
jgi:uncharacterized phage protein (TIGR02218 family)